MNVFNGHGRSVLVTIAFLLAPLAQARGYYWNYAQRGNATAVTSLSGTTAKFQASYPGAGIRADICGTSTLATLYTNSSGTAKSNPFTAASTGYYDFWTDAPCVSLTFSGESIPTPFTIGNVTIPTSGTGGNIAGAVCNNIVDDTAAVSTALASAGLHELPAGICRVTDELVIAQSYTTFAGQGAQTTSINFVPTAGGKVGIKVGLATSTVISGTRIRDLRIYSEELTLQKTAIQITDGSETVIENVKVGPRSVFTGGASISPFTGGGSIGIKTRGREFWTFRDLDLGADIPLYIAANPNAPGLELDHFHTEGFSYLLPNGSNPSIYVEGAAVLSNATFQGMAWVGGNAGFYWNDSASVLTSSRLTFRQIRAEQFTSTGYGWLISKNAVLQGLRIEDSSIGGTARGVYLRQVSPSIFDGFSYTGTGVCLDTNSPADWRSSFCQTGSTVTIGAGLTRLRRDEFVGAGYPMAMYERVVVTTSTLDAGECSMFMGVYTCAKTGTVTSGATVALPSFGGGVTVARVEITFHGATKDGAFSAFYTQTTAGMIETSDTFSGTTAITGIGNNASKINLHYSSPSSVVIRNNLAETVTYSYWLTMN